MKDNKNLLPKASQNIVDRLCWCTAKKDQASIANDLASGKDIPEVYGLGEAGFFDEFFYFLDTLKISNLFNGLDPNLTDRSSNINFHRVLLIYMMRIVSGLSFFWHIEPVLLRSQSLMRIVGFNGIEIREGTCKRGLKGEKKVVESTDTNQNSKDNSTEIRGPICVDPISVPATVEATAPTEIRGPICADSIAAYIEAIAAKALEKFFNGVISVLAANSFFPKHVHAVLDASEIETTENCTDCGKVTKEKAPELRNRNGRIRKVLETVFGFKIWAVWDPNSKLPIAIRFTTIEVGDIIMAKEVVKQAIDNLGDHAKMTSLAIDRGFMDGKFLWWLEHDTGITFYIPAKTNMNVYEDALALVETGIHQKRQKNRTIGYGKNKRTVTDNYEAVGIEGLTSAGFYGELGSGSHENNKNFVSNPINAVVILDDHYKKNNPNSDTMIILTNGPVKEPLKVYDGYDDRSEIENSLFRELKQAWFIERPARNSAAGYRSHVYLTIITMALTTAFRYWMDKQDKLNRQGKETGIRKFREKVQEENGNKLIVFDEDRYAIFDVYEVFILCGRNVAKPRGIIETITKEDILRKYNAILE